MPIRFSDLVKAQITQALAKTLLERAGYRVTRLGIEELYYELKMLDREQYLALGLPVTLRTLPDLLVANPDVSEAHLVEVKYRRQFTDPVARNLHNILSDQFERWPGSKAILMIGEPFVTGGRFHQDYMRVIDESNLSWLLPEGPGIPDPADPDGGLVTFEPSMRWDQLKHLQWVFDGCADFAILDEADLITRTVRDLTALP